MNRTMARHTDCLKQIMAAPGPSRCHVGLYKIAREAIGTHEAATAPDWICAVVAVVRPLLRRRMGANEGRVNEAERILNELLPNPGLRPPAISFYCQWQKSKPDLDSSTKPERLAMDAIDNIRTLGDADLNFSKTLIHYQRRRTAGVPGASNRHGRQSGSSQRSGQSATPIRRTIETSVLQNTTSVLCMQNSGSNNSAQRRSHRRLCRSIFPNRTTSMRSSTTRESSTCGTASRNEKGRDYEIGR